MELYFLHLIVCCCFFLFPDMNQNEDVDDQIKLQSNGQKIRILL